MKPIVNAGAEGAIVAFESEHILALLVRENG